jgi:hypothetical protein
MFILSYPVENNFLFFTLALPSEAEKLRDMPKVTELRND